MQKFLIKNEEDAIVLAQQIVSALSGGQTIGITGQLGAGKTFLVKKIGLALGIKETIKSPSFNLMKVYNIKTKKEVRTSSGRDRSWGVKTLVHIDCYRLNSADELIDIGLLDYLGQKNVLVIIEWADKIKSILPKNTIWIDLKIDKNNARVVRIKNLKEG